MAPSVRVPVAVTGEQKGRQEGEALLLRPTGAPVPCVAELGPRACCGRRHFGVGGMGRAHARCRKPRYAMA